MGTLSIKSYAKINISLGVEPKRSDGYHELDSIMVPLELHDSIHLTKLANGLDNYITVDDFSNGEIKFNLASAAIDKLAEKCGFSTKFRVFIHKNIPMQGGLGGGSSNAAFVLNGVKKMLKLDISDEELIKLAAPIGADVPFFLNPHPCRCKGIGEKITPITIKNNYFVLLIKPKEGCSTSAVFREFDTLPFQTYNMDNVVKALEEGDDDLLADSLFNSLEAPAFNLCPEIKDIKNLLMCEGLKLVLMTGSGSCVFALSRDLKVLKNIQKKHEDKYWIEITKILR